MTLRTELDTTVKDAVDNATQTQIVRKEDYFLLR